ncbi:MAG: hypothetical protein ABI790_11375 [Betaproteobacteria bacterium]
MSTDNRDPRLAPWPPVSSSPPSMTLLDQSEIERLIKAEKLKIRAAPGAKEKIPYTQSERALFSAAVMITVNHMAAKVVAITNRLEQRISELEKQASGEKT